MGPISVPVRSPKVWVPISLESVYGRWRITARLAQLRSSDTGWSGELRLEAASRNVRRDAPNNAWIRRDRVVQGWLIGRGLVTAFADPGLDSVRVVGYFTASGALEILEGFYMADGGFISLDLLGSDRMRGEWSPPGEVVPEFMGWICAVRILAADTGSPAPAVGPVLRPDSTTCWRVVADDSAEVPAVVAGPFIWSSTAEVSHMGRVGITALTRDPMVNQVEGLMWFPLGADSVIFGFPSRGRHFTFVLGLGDAGASGKRIETAWRHRQVNAQGEMVDIPIHDSVAVVPARATPLACKVADRRW